MSNFFITPILYHYNFLEELCNEASKILFIDENNIEKYNQFKISIFLNFNRYLIDSLLFLPGNESSDLFEKLTPFMQIGDEKETLNLLNSYGDTFSKIRSEFILIIINSKK